MKRFATAAAAALVLTVGAAAPAHAGPNYDPENEKPATPGQACRAIANTIDLVGPIVGLDPDDVGFKVGRCASKLAKPNFTFEFFGTPVQEQCAILKEAFIGDWPYTFYEEEVGGIDDLLPELTARTDKECTHALYAYHTIANLIPEPPGA